MPHPDHPRRMMPALQARPRAGTARTTRAKPSPPAAPQSSPARLIAEEECVRQGGCGTALANLAASVLINPGRNNRPALRRNGHFSGSSGGKRRPEPHGHKSFRPSFSTSSVSTPTIRLPRLTQDSLEGTPGGACQTAQKDVSVSWSRYMIVLLVRQSRRIVACEAQVPRAVSTGADTRSRSRSQRLLRDLGAGSGPARLGLGARRDAPALRLPAIVTGVALSWPASRRAPCEGRLERGLPSSK